MASKMIEKHWQKEFDSGRTRTYNLLLRRQAPYPLGHRAVVSQLRSNFFYFFRALYYANLRSKALSGELSIIISKNRIFNHVMAIRMITWISFIRRREFRNARGIFNQCNRYFCTWKSNVLLHNFRTRQSEFISLSSTLEIHSHTFILQENVVEYLINDRFHDTTVKFTTKLRRECNWKKKFELRSMKLERSFNWNILLIINQHIPKLSPTHFVSFFSHQHLCSQIHSRFEKLFHGGTV